jgi:hypothetical protein
MKTLEINEKYLPYLSTANYTDCTISFPCEVQLEPWKGEIDLYEDARGAPYLRCNGLPGMCRNTPFTTKAVESYIDHLLLPANIEEILAELDKRKQEYEQEVKQDITWYKPEYKLPDMSRVTNASELLLVKVKKDNALSLELTDDAILAYAFIDNNSVMFVLDYSAIRETLIKTSDIEYWCYLPKPY